ncbi:7-carboxy-7-deazaguanine synthase QueE [Alicyclobacillus cellulosilyticus]|uniref:7-carboxy-7-deazaguanine synthase QueE n=1 Tax=Alicyclobacillus cellulosilyticus TaxID=1003997 RepID=UPI00166B0A7B|nr:7-carboxy-7-deazaguanine synthase QueE [Alicyclobacillus cellulosilyticus]
MTRTATEARLPVLEVFGPTIQGEGMMIGQKTMFVRTAGCDYRCAWCDSKFTWDGSERHLVRHLTPAEVLAEVCALGQDRFQHVTVSGGNPALIGEPMAEFIRLCHERELRVGLETQGSRWQDWFTEIDDLSISPKGPSSGMETDWDVLDDLVARLTSHGVHFSLKVVVFNAADLAFARAVFARYPHAEKYLQPGNEDVAAAGDISRRLLDKLAWLFEQVIADKAFNDVRVLPQLHALVWGNKRRK